MAAANFAGAVVVFVFLNWVLPNPGVRHLTRVQIINAAVFVGLGLVTFPAVWIWNSRRWRSMLGWTIAGRSPSERERRMTLRWPLTQQASVAPLWVAAAIIFGALNAPYSGTLAADIAIAIVLGGLLTISLGYLLAERLLRPVTARVLAEGVPTRPELPGVRTRALLSWTLGTGVVLLGLVLTAIAAIDGEGFTRERLAVAVVVLSGIGMVVGLAAIDVLSRSIADRIEALREAVGKVGEGQLDSAVEVDDGSELGLLQAGFNRMLAGLQERERLRELFGRQVGEDVARLALERGVELGGEARRAAVLFVDLQGSTSLAERRDPAEVVALLNRFFAIVVEVVGAHEGWVNKFEGDAALCVFGAPLPDEHAAAQALAAARELCSRLRDELPAVRAGIGVSAGRVVAGNVGAAKRFEYTVIGDPVNQAARLTELAKERPERALASAEALTEAGSEEAARWRVCDELTLRGRSRPTQVAVPQA